MEHLVDAVVTLEGERFAALRLVRSTKNRFGSTDEVGVFEMTGDGLREVLRPGTSIPCRSSRSGARQRGRTDDGGQPPIARRGAGPRVGRWLRDARSQGERDRPEPPRAAGRGARPTSGHRAGRARRLRESRRRLSVAEPGLDLPVALALASSLRDRPILTNTVAIGEVGLLGELRSVAGLERRLREASRLGFGTAIVPRPGRGGRAVDVPSLDIVEVATLRDAISVGLGDGPRARGDAVPAMLG
jgi:DNA repair protein RadA/Sms